jgi:hypothetical protein
MATLQDRLSLTKEPDFRQRIRMAMVSAAVDVQGEATDSPGMTPAKYTKRQTLATKVITTAGEGTPDEDLKRMFVFACANNTLADTYVTAEYNAESIPDGDIQFTVNSVWDDCAGVTGMDTAV